MAQHTSRVSQLISSVVLPYCRSETIVWSCSEPNNCVCQLSSDGLPVDPAYRIMCYLQVQAYRAKEDKALPEIVISRLFSSSRTYKKHDILSQQPPRSLPRQAGRCSSSSQPYAGDNLPRKASTLRSVWPARATSISLSAFPRYPQNWRSIGANKATFFKDLEQYVPSQNCYGVLCIVVKEKLSYFGPGILQKFARSPKENSSEISVPPSERNRLQ